MKVDESNLLVWQGLLVPDSAPYNKEIEHFISYAWNNHEFHSYWGWGAAQMKKHTETKLMEKGKKGKWSECIRSLPPSLPHLRIKKKFNHLLYTFVLRWYI